MGWPLPRHWPDADGLQRWAQRPGLSPAVLVDVAACLLWLVWAWLVYVVGAELLTRLTRVRLPRLRLPSPMQAAASGMVGAVVLGATGTRGPGAAGPPAAGAAAATAVRVVDVAAAYPDAGRPVGQPTMVDLPDGGSVSVDTADTLDATVALLWLRRRRRYRPGPPSGANRTDTDLTAPAAGVAALIRAVGRRHGDDDHSPWPAAPVHADAAGPATLGEYDGQRLRPHQLPAGGVGLVGPGAADAARAILAAVTLAGVRQHGGPARLLTTGADLHHLLDDHRPADPGIGGLSVADGIEAALAELDRRLLDLIRPDGDHSGHTGTAGPVTARADGRRTPLVLLTGVPGRVHADRLAVTLRLAAGVGVRGVLLGAWPHGVTWHIDADGTARQPDGRPATRLGMLTAEVTGEILTLVRQCATDPPAAGGGGLPAPAIRPGPYPDPDPDVWPSRGATGPTVTGGTPDPAAVVPLSVGRLRLRLLGPPTVWLPGPAGEAVPIQRRAAVEILTFLAVHRGGSTGGQIMAAVWPDLRRTPATGRLHTTLSALRVALREAAGCEVVERAGEAYRLDPHQIHVDLWQLHDAVDRAAGTLDRAGRQQALREVTGVYGGPLAAGLRRPWLDPHRETARRHIVDAHIELAADTHDPQRALALLRTAAGHDPDNEELHRILMRHHAVAGNPAGVRQTLRAFTDHLATHGQHPDGQTRQLADQLLATGETDRTT